MNNKTIEYNENGNPQVYAEITWCIGGVWFASVNIGECYNRTTKDFPSLALAQEFVATYNPKRVTTEGESKPYYLNEGKYRFAND